MQYYKVFCEGLAGKRNFIPLTKNPSIGYNKDGYSSLYLYGEESKKKAEEAGTVSAVEGEVTNRLLFDFDSKSNLEQAKTDSLVLVNRLLDNGFPLESIKTFFSGNKGFNVEVGLNNLITPTEFKQTVFQLAGDLQTFDKVVNEPNRIIRIPNTKHQETQLYKIPLELYDLDEKTIPQIKEMAKTPKGFEQVKTNTEIPQNLQTYYTAKKKESPSTTKIDNHDLKSVLLNRPSQWKPWKWALLQGFFGEGERHTALVVLAATCRGMGMDKNTTYYMCKAALKKQAERTGKDEFDKVELWENIIEKSVFSPNWQGGQFSPENNEWLADYCKRNEIEWENTQADIKSISEIETDFAHFVKHIEENTIKTGIRTLDEYLPITIGMNLGVVGAASSGKTAMALMMLKNTSKAGIVSVFASLDMHRNRLFEKLLYKETGLDRKELYAEFNAGRGHELTASIKEDFKNVYFYDRSCPSVEDVKNYIKQVEDATGKKVKLVMVDYFERLNSDKSEDTAASKDVAGSLQDLINDLNVAVVTLVQPNKFSLSGGPDTPITSYTSIKGSSFLYQSFRSILSIWRPFFNPETFKNDKYMQMAILKNDLGELGIFDFSWEGKRGEIREMEDWEQEDFKKLMIEKKAKKGAEESWV
jgi:hypothetical protein